MKTLLPCLAGMAMLFGGLPHGQASLIGIDGLHGNDSNIATGGAFDDFRTTIFAAGQQ